MKRLFKILNKRWLLLVMAAMVIMATLWYSRVLVRQLAKEERDKVHIWADAIQRRAESVIYMEQFYRDMAKDERSRIGLWAEAYSRWLDFGDQSSHNANDFDYYRQVVLENKTIPFVITDSENNITLTGNTNINTDSVKVLSGKLLDEFSKYPPIIIEMDNMPPYYVYYKQSIVYTQLTKLLDGVLNSFIAEIVENSVEVPVIVTDESQQIVLSHGNIDNSMFNTPEKLARLLSGMASQNTPIEIKVSENKEIFIYYEDSLLLRRLSWFPVLSVGMMITLLILIIYVLGLSRQSEQNQLWAGMSKETAHQLGTPISSLMAWTEYLKAKEMDPDTIEEMNKDIKRLEIITQRFSKIGSVPTLTCENLVPIVYRSISYLKARTSRKLTYHINLPENAVCITDLNVQLFEWVIENLCKNATDAIGDNEGCISIQIVDTPKHIIIDVSDTGKGMPKSMFKKIFETGYTSKSRGWGLGLTLCKRIINDYHQGKIFVKSSILGKGTTFRIILKHTDACSKSQK